MHCIYGAHLEFFFFLLRFYLIGSGGRDVITAFIGRLSCMEVMEHFRGLFSSYDLNIHVQLISLVLFFGSPKVDATWVSFFSTFFNIFPDVFFHARKVHQKKGFILSSISALRLLLHVHI
jgi:hypothetical protein